MEAHLLRENDLTDTHTFLEDVKIHCFCLTLVGEARLWYKSLRPMNVDWNRLQNKFQQQYSKTGITREQLFHMWKSFHSYVAYIRQVATLLGYCKPQVLEVFKNTHPT